jgi:hypothetical protein
LSVIGGRDDLRLLSYTIHMGRWNRLSNPVLSWVVKTNLHGGETPSHFRSSLVGWGSNTGRVSRTKEADDSYRPVLTVDFSYRLLFFRQR